MMKDPARLVIPVWGEVYASKVTSITLPAVLAPGNLPALCQTFAVELVIVTESRLFESIRSSPSFQAAAKICAARLVALDDLLTDSPRDYGMVLTYALFRGFADLGARVTETHLLFLNADFIISDGSLRHLGGLMREGKRVIHAPSFRVVREDVWPQLQARVDNRSCTLSVPPRDLVRLALANKHPTVKARTVNQRLGHQSWMDQFYWYVDEDTLIGYQAPVALVAIKPERAVSEPIAFWDFGFVPEAAPTAQPHFIGDSDDFFMIEPQSRTAGQDVIRLGWVSANEVARGLSMWLTKEQRDCCKQLLTIHARDLPPDIDAVIAESRAYMAEVFRRMSPEPVPHIGHPQLGAWFEETKQRRRGYAPPARSLEREASARAIAAGKTPGRQRPLAAVLAALQTAYRRMFGAPPHIGKYHPLWMDVAPMTGKTAAWQASGATNILSIDSGDWLRQSLSDGGETSAALQAAGDRAPVEGARYDVCICQIEPRELWDLDRVYAGIRPLVKDGGHIVFKAVRTHLFEGTKLFLDRCNFPDIDVSEIHFYGTAATALLRALYLPALRPISTRPIARSLIVCALFCLAPLARLANVRAERRDSTIFSPLWTSLIVQFTVKRARQREAGRQPTRASVGLPML
jgi:hypothetical protein